jgi:hypothetical protein
MDWVTNLLSKISEGFQTSVASLNNLLTTLNNATTEMQNVTTGGWIPYVGAFRYVVGDVIYLTFYTMILLGLGFMVFNIILIIKNQFAFGGGLINTIKGVFFK